MRLVRFGFVSCLGIVVTGAVACADKVGLEDRPCPCVAGYTCDESRNVCVSEGSPGLYYASGTRLQVRGYQVDGIFVVAGLFDTKLGLACTPGLASDGVERCLPRDVLPFSEEAEATDSGPDYANPGCTGLVLAIAKAQCSDPSHVVVSDRAHDEYRDRASFWRIGAPIAPGIIYRPAMGSCQPRTASPKTAYFERGQAFEPTDFVAFVRREQPLSTRLSAVVLEGEDGTRFRLDRDFVDVTRGKPCTVTVTEDGAMRCAPSTPLLVDGRFFVDPSCTTRAATGLRSCARGPGSCDPTVAAERIWSSSQCEHVRWRYFSAGPDSSSRNLYSGVNGCQFMAEQPLAPISLGAPISTSEFPAIATSASPRVRLVEQTLSSSGERIGQVAVYDPSLADTCRFEKAADGKTRCLPANPAAPAAFADPDCSAPLYTISSCSRLSSFARIPEGSPCDPVVHVHALVKASRAFQRNEGRCEELFDVDPFYAVSDEIPPGMFVEATAVVR